MRVVRYLEKLNWGDAISLIELAATEHNVTDKSCSDIERVEWSSDADKRMGTHGEGKLEAAAEERRGETDKGTLKWEKGLFEREAWKERWKEGGQKGCAEYWFTYI